MRKKERKERDKIRNKQGKTTKEKIEGKEEKREFLKWKNETKKYGKKWRRVKEKDWRKNN